MPARDTKAVRRLFALCAALTLTASFASPASEYLNEVEGYLRAYDGPSAADPAALERDAERELAQRCAQDAACPLGVGREVAKTLVAGFADKHTNLKDPPVARRARAEIRGESVPRVGLRLVPLEGGGAVVGYVRPASPAARAGLVGGEFVGAVNGGEANAANLADAEDGAAVRLQLAERELTLRAEELPARDLPTLRAVNGVNVVNIPSFLGEGVAKGFFDTLRGLDPGAPLVVDVRANGGGSLNECLLAASAFGEVRHELGTPRYTARYRAVNGQLLSGNRRTLTLDPVRAAPVNRVTVLVGPRTASCGEVFAGALQGLGATIIGTPTAGVKNSAVGLYDLSDGSMLSVTTSKATNGRGQLLDAAVIPNREVQTRPEDARAGLDPVLDAAVTLALGMAQR